MPPPPRSSTLAVGDAFGYGWNGFKNNLVPVITIAGLLVVVSLLSYFIQLVIKPDSFIVSSLFSLVFAVVNLFVALALIKATLQILDGEHPTLDKIVNGDLFVPFLIASVLVYIGTVIGLILCLIPGIIFGFLMMFYGYALVDRTTEDPVESMRVSYGVASKNAGSLIVLVLVAIVFNMLGACLCGIGLLVTAPITYIALGYAWRTLTGGQIAPQA